MVSMSMEGSWDWGWRWPWTWTSVWVWTFFRIMFHLDLRDWAGWPEHRRSSYLENRKGWVT